MMRKNFYIMNAKEEKIAKINTMDRVACYNEALEDILNLPVEHIIKCIDDRRKLTRRCIKPSDVNLFEINEHFIKDHMKLSK